MLRLRNDACENMVFQSQNKMDAYMELKCFFEFVVLYHNDTGRKGKAYSTITRK